MKNIIKISIIVFIICLLSTLNVYATGTSVNIASRATECKIDDTFEVVISFKCEEDFKGLTGTLEYDNTKLKLEKAVSEGYFDKINSKNSQGEYVVSIFNNVDASENMTIIDGECQTITFKVLEGATAGETLEIKLSDIQIKTGENKETIGEQVTTVKIVSESEKTDDPSDAGNNSSDGDEGKEDPAGDGKKPESEQKPPKHEYAGLEDYTFAMIVGVVVIAVIAYIKYKKYSNI